MPGCKYLVQLTTIQDAKEFVQAANECKVELELESGRHRICAKSLMGLFALDLSKPIYMVSENGTLSDEEEAKFKRWILN